MTLNIKGVSSGDIIQANLFNGVGYHADTLQSYPILSPEEVYGTLAVPRGPRCALFDGVDDKALGTNLAATSDITISAWTNVTAANSNIMQVGKTTFRVSGTGLIWYPDADLAPVAVTTSTSGAIHFAIVQSGTSYTFYKNGIAISSGTTDVIDTGVSTFQLGMYASTTWPFAGKMWDVRLYNVAKSPYEINNIYNQANTPTTLDRTGLVGGWWLNEESGTTAYDWSGNGKNLTYTNITESTFHATDSSVTYNPANWLGHTKALKLTSSGGTNYGLGNGWAGGLLTGDFDLQYVLDGTSADFVVGVNATNDSSLTYGQFPIGLQYLNSTTIRVWDSGGPTSVTTTATQGRIFRITRVGSTVNVYNNGVSIHSGSITTNPLYAAASLNATAYTSLQLISPIPAQVTTYQGGSLTIKDIIISRNEASTTLDSAGSTLGVIGPVSRPVTTEVLCLTGNGTTAYANLGSALIPATADFSLSLWYNHTNTATRHGVFGQYPTSAIYLGANQGAGGATVAGSFTLRFSADGPIVTGIASGWVYITISRVGNLFTLTVNGVSASATVAATFGVAQNFTLLALAGPILLSPGSVSNFSVTTGGVTKIFPLQDGPGANNVNRNLSWIGSDGTGGVINSALVGGTVSAIWANRCPYAQDWCVKYGGRLTNENMTLYSESLLSGWNSYSNNASIFENALDSPIDTANADLFVASSGTTFQSKMCLSGGIAVLTGKTYTFSAYVKSRGHRYVGLADSSLVTNGQSHVFDFDTGTFTQGLYGKSEALADGWYRIAMEKMYVAGSNNVRLSVFLSQTPTTNIYGQSVWSVGGNGIDGVYVVGMQLNEGDLKPYQKTTGVAVYKNVFIPGKTSGSTAVDGFANTITAGKFGNPGSRRYPNTWSAPELTAIGLTSTSTLEDLPIGTFANASSIYADLGAKLTNSVSALTITAWMKTTIGAGQYGVAGQYSTSTEKRNWLLHVDAGYPKLVISSDGTATTVRTSSVLVNDNVWRHVAAVYDGLTMNIYIDGVLSNGTLTGTIPTSTFNNSASFLIGAFDTGSPTNQFTGSMFDVRCYNSAKTNSEIVTIMTGAIDDAGLLGQWMCSEGSGTTLFDSSINGKNLTLSGTLTNFWATKTYQSLVPRSLRNLVTRFTKWGRSKVDGNDRYVVTRALPTNEAINRINRTVE